MPRKCFLNISSICVSPPAALCIPASWLSSASTDRTCASVWTLEAFLSPAGGICVCFLACRHHGRSRCRVCARGLFYLWPACGVFGRDWVCHMWLGSRRRDGRGMNVGRRGILSRRIRLFSCRCNDRSRSQGDPALFARGLLTLFCTWAAPLLFAFLCGLACILRTIDARMA